MAPAELSGLPPELLLRIADHLTAGELLPLSATNSSLRECLLPVVFRVLRVTNRPEEASIALNLAKKHSQYITTISFEGHASPADNGRETRGRVWGPKGSSTLPMATRKLLQGRYLPKLRTARVRFAFEYASEDWSVDPSTGDRTRGFYDFDAGQFDDDIAQREPKWKWRALMAETWMALAQNKQIVNLEIVDLPPRGTTSFINPVFQSFLRRLERVTLSIWGSTKGAGWKIETFPGYLAFLSCMHGWFFKHLDSATSLRLSASADGLDGLTGTLPAGMALQREALPLLSTLELSLVAVDSNLIAFVSGHAAGLRSVSFDRCLCTPNTVFRGIEAKDGIKWADLFKILQHSRFGLTSLEITPRIANFSAEAAESGKAKAIQKKLKDDPHLRIFGYGEAEEWNTEDLPSRDHELNLQAFMLGDDMREYDALMEIIAANAKAKR